MKDRGTCTVEGCSKPIRSAGLCNGHRAKKWREENSHRIPQCSVEGCENPRASGGLCAKHKYRLQKYGDTSVVRQVQGGPTAERLMAHVDRRGNDECWPWTGHVSERGYGSASRGGRAGATPAHRLIYETFVGSIPEGMDIDHLCHVAEQCRGGDTCPHRRCCNPRHLAPERPVPNTMRGNSPAAVNARKTHCKNGHPFDAANTQVSTKGNRSCRICRAEWKRRRRAAGLKA